MRIFRPAVPYRPGGAEASRTELFAGRFEDARSRDSAINPDNRRAWLQPGIFRRCDRAEGEPGRAEEPGLDGRNHEYDVRADDPWRAYRHDGRGEAACRDGQAGRSRRAAGWEDAYVRQRIARFACEAEGLKYTSYRQLTRQLRGLPPGPEGSMMKLCTSDLNLRIQIFAMELLGPYSQFEYQADHAIDKGKWSHRMLAARRGTIAAGTNEIQHNIIGERVLGLPKG